MKEKLKKQGYIAPRMEATSFRTENGYAGSQVKNSGTQTLGIDVPISFGA